MLQIRTKTFTYPKTGANESQNDDAFDCKENDRVFRYAVADGATESIYAGRWARMIATAFVEGSLSGNSNKRNRKISLLQAEWTKFLRDQKFEWYAEKKAEEGSFTTLVGLELYENNGNGYWNIKAVGDSCVFVTRKDQRGVDNLFLIQPIQAPEEFNNRPNLIPSNSRYNNYIGKWIDVHKQSLFPGDTFYLMTDALSLWFCRNRDKEPWNKLIEITHGDSTAFRDWVLSLRQKDDAMNDDSTMLYVEVM